MWYAIGGGDEAGEGLKLDGIPELARGADDGQASVCDLPEECGVVEVAVRDVGGDVEQLAAELGEGAAALGEVVQRDVGDVAGAPGMF